MKKELTVCDICGEHKETTHHRLMKGQYPVTDREGDKYIYTQNIDIDICSSCMYSILTNWHRGLSQEERCKLANTSLYYRNDCA
jgi:hypothetical protein